MKIISIENITEISHGRYRVSWEVNATGSDIVDAESEDDAYDLVNDMNPDDMNVPEINWDNFNIYHLAQVDEDDEDIPGTEINY